MLCLCDVLTFEDSLEQDPLGEAVVGSLLMFPVTLVNVHTCAPEDWSGLIEVQPL